MSKDNNLLANYIIDELNLKNPIHSLMWRIERLNNLIESLDKKIKQTNNEALIEEKKQLDKEFGEISRTIFSTND